MAEGELQLMICARHIRRNLKRPEICRQCGQREWQGSWDMVGVCTRRGGVALASEVVPPGLHPRPLALRRVHVVEHLRQQISPIIKPTGLLLRPSRSHLLEGEPVHVVHLGPGPARCENQPVCETDAVVAV